MDGGLKDWRDTLEDLGLLGLVPPPPDPSLRPPVPESPARPVAAPQRSRALSPPSSPPAAPVWTPPTDAVGCPPREAVASAATLAELEARAQGCLACPLGPGRLRFVFGEGNPSADLMFIGEGPGRDEDLQGRPFVGRAGELLDKMIGAIGLERSEVYIANVVKCRPPDNRVPTASEAQRCLGYLMRQIDLIQPRVIVTLGATPLRELLGVGEGITRVRGQWKRLEPQGIPVMPTFHPAYVLRQYTDDVRRAVWTDLKAARAWLDRPKG